MQVIQKSSSGTQSFPLDAMLLAQRTVFLTGVLPHKQSVWTVILV